MSENFNNLNWGQSEREDWSFSSMANRQQYYKCLWSSETKSRNPTPCTERQGVKLARTAAKSRKISGVNIMLAGTTHNNNAGGLWEQASFCVWCGQSKSGLLYDPLGGEGGELTHIFLSEDGLVWIGCPSPPSPKRGEVVGVPFSQAKPGEKVFC